MKQPLRINYLNSSKRNLESAGRAPNCVRARLFVLAVCLALVATCASTVLAVEPQVTVRGNRVFNDGAIKSYVLKGGSSPGALSAGLAAVQEAYYREGYLLALVEVAPGSTDSTLVLKVSEGEIARYGRVSITGSRKRTAEAIRSSLGLNRGDAFVPRLLDRRIQELLQSYDDEGYPFAQIWLDSLALDFERNLVHVGVFVVEGEERILQNVNVDGLKKTRPELAVRLSGLKTGQPYRAEMLRDAYLRLSSSEVFEHVDYPKLRISSDGSGVDAVLIVHESKRTSSFSSALGYATADNGEDREISGLVQLKLNNIGGTLKDLSVFWSNDGKERTETKLHYRDRFFLGRRMSVGLFVEQVGLDTLYSWQSAGTEVERPVGRLGGGLIGLSGGVFGDRSVFSEGDLLRSWRLRFTSGFSLLQGSGRSKGYFRARLRFTLARKKTYWRATNDGETLTQYVVEFEGDGSVRLRPVVHLGIGLVYRGLESSETVIPLSERFYIGGARTLRGYKENQFNGRRIATMRNELRLGNRSSENVYLFTDLGYVFRETVGGDDEISKEDLFKVGYGFGLRTRSPIGNVDLSFGVGDKLSLQQTKVHVLLEQNF